MPIPLFFSFLFFFFFLHPSLSSADPFYHFCDDNGNYTANTTYATNLKQILSSLPTNASRSSGFAKSTVGSTSNIVSALALCCGDTNSSCRSFLDLSFQEAAQLCPFYKSVTIYYDLCLLSYSNQLFLSSTDNSHQVFAWNVNNITDKRFGGESNHSTSKFATSEMNIPDTFPTLYGLVQCTLDLSNGECRQCLQNLINETLKYFDGKQGGWVLGLRSNLRQLTSSSAFDGASFSTGQLTAITGCASFSLPLHN
ncbi:antimicrobial ginkbilobin-2-like protein [Typha angustifolia]|uniref:antimicrobial ginkbilobin-2-like protein n=1 Tax=Typha angustifolia TaxID=59011 RepID=UPI003C309D6B